MFKQFSTALILFIYLSLFATQSCSSSLLPSTAISPHSIQPKVTFQHFFIKKFLKSRFCYSSNNSPTFNPTLLISGDIELNPGPILRSKCPVCVECNVKIISKISAISCILCNNLLHTKCKPSIYHDNVCSNCHTNIPFIDHSLNSSTTSFTSSNDSLSSNLSSPIKLLQSNNTKHLKIMHFNIRSLYQNIDHLKEYLTAYNYSPDIILLSETWLKLKLNSRLTSISIPNYTFISSPRDWSKGGGVGIYIKHGITFNKIHALSKNLPKTFEHLLINVKGKSANSRVIVGVVYRPPNSNTDWFEHFQTLHQALLSYRTNNFILGGDFNINLLHTNTLSSTFSNILTSLDLKQTISEATRITHNTANLLDLFITNNSSQIIDSNVLQHNPITDHETIYAIYKLNQPKFTPTIKSIRNIKNFNIHDYLTDFQNLPFNHIYLDCRPEIMLSTFTTLIKSVIDKHAPLINIKITKPPAPWIDSTIKKLMQHRNNLLRKVKANSDSTYLQKYTIIKKQVKLQLALAKQNFINNCLNKPSTKGVWNVINKLLKPNSFNIKHDLNKLNMHFVNTSERVLGKIPNNKKFCFDHSNSQGTFSFSTVSMDLVLQYLNKIKTDTATGPDLIPAKFIKPAAHIIAPHLTNIINSSIQNNIFPASWKSSRISPVPKVDNPCELNDYRPISILPAFSKIFEKIMAKQIIYHFESSNLFPSTLSGCREGHSTITALLHIKDACYKALKASELTILTLIDFSKAFDTVSHHKLLDILSQFYFSKSAIILLQSYLSDRTQFIQANNSKSDILNINSGVPRDLSLGLFFLTSMLPLLTKIYPLISLK